MSKKSIARLFAALAVLFLFPLCSRFSDPPNAPPGEEATGEAYLTIEVGQVGRLAKTTRSAEIALETLFVTLYAEAEDSVHRVFSLVGNDRNVISTNYPGLDPDKQWAVSAYSKDATGKTVHSGSTTFDVDPGETAQVNLALVAQYSMLHAAFFPIRDSVTKCELLVDGEVKDDTTFDVQSMVGDTVRLSYDYLSANTSHSVSLVAYGSVGDSTYELYKCDTVFQVVAGAHRNYHATLRWVGPMDPPDPGSATITVYFGPVPEINVEGELEDVTEAQWLASLPRVEVNLDTLRANATWHGDTGYVIKRPLHVDSGVTLTVEPGAAVLFEENVYISCSGEILARGTEENRILFTSAADTQRVGDYAGIKVFGGAVPAILDANHDYASGSAFQYCDFEYADEVEVRTNVDFRYCAFKKCNMHTIVGGHAGLRVDHGGLQCIIACRFTDTRGNGLFVQPRGNSVLYMDSCEFANIGTIFLVADTTIVRNTTFAGFRQPIYVNGKQDPIYFDHCTFENVGVQGSWRSNSQFRYCLFSHVATPFNYAGRVVFCTFYDCANIRLTGGAFCRFNNLYDGASPFSLAVVSPGDVSAASNYWGGLRDSTAIAARITDFNDEFDADLGVVNFMPFRVTPLPMNPVYEE